ncbi:HAD family hydrolase [Polycladidibacter stylochi]|uniref:HAD family hydrolase n=1 Tax=Polycladidibacter stylochi TaxID=1807766 RepID=UPI0008329527|nr:HAD-IB family hydrolase [Pseudovibrio stylochi]
MSGNNKFAFFDVDETLVFEKTMFSILNKLSFHFNELDAASLLKQLRDMRLQNIPREEVNRYFYRSLAGLKQIEVRKIAKDYINMRLANNGHRPFLIPETVKALHDLKKNGFEPVFVSGSAIDFLFQLAQALGVRHVLATALSTDSKGCYTGKLSGDCMIGAGKANAVGKFMATHKADPALCYAFGDHISDADFISLVGHGNLVEGSSAAEHLAVERGWTIIPLQNPLKAMGATL